MRYSFLTAALAVPCTLAAPAKRQNLDVTVLQFALTLEHLENVFYKGALQKFSAADFQAAGYGANYYNNIKYIASDEQSHVELLKSALSGVGVTPTAACTYNFPYTDVNSFVGLSAILEGVGTSAYLGGAPLITNKAYLTVAGSILVTEALHTSLQRGAVNEIPFGSPYGTPLDPTSVFTLAAAFIKSCPQSNPALPFKPYPALTLNTTAGTCEQPDCGSGKYWSSNKKEWRSWSAPSTTAPKYAAAIKVGASVHFTLASDAPAGSFLTFVSGLSVTSVAASGSGKTVYAAIPATASGQTYVLLTSSAAANNTIPSTVVAGPAIIEVAPPAPMIDFNEA